MQNGKQITELIQQLWETDQDWEKYIGDNDEDIPEAVDVQMNRLMYELRAVLKTGAVDEVLQCLCEAGTKPAMAELLVKNVKKSLEFYFNFLPLRHLEKQDKILLKGLLSSIYQKYIIRFERGYLSQIEIGEIKREELYNIADRIDYLTDYYVSRSYTKKGIVRDLIDESGLSEESCEYWADLIDQNYLLLKLNYITEELGKIRINTSK